MLMMPFVTETEKQVFIPIFLITVENKMSPVIDVKTVIVIATTSESTCPNFI